MLGWWVLTSTALAGPSSETWRPRPVAGHPVFDLRVGVDRLEDVRHPFLCAEGAPTRWLSFEACGNGAGFLHQDPSPDMAHFRALGRLAGFGAGRGSIDLRVGGGFAEVQRGADAPGFRFGPAREADPVEAAGPEASASLKGRWWLDGAGRAYLVGDLAAGVALIPGAPDVFGRGGPAVPFAAFTAGLGF